MGWIHGAKRMLRLTISLRPFALLPLCMLLIVCCTRVNAQVLPIHDDATLHDVQFVGSKVGFAVGDHGVIWHSDNGGQSWKLIPSPVDCPLKSVCFLTDRIGWIAGGGTTPHTRINYGVVLFTNNAGESWQIMARDTVPPIEYIKFFGLQQGVAVGASSQEHPTGLLTTQDGGKTWEPVLGEGHTAWRTAVFLQPKVGVVAGRRGQVKLVGGGRLLASQSGTKGLQNVHAVAMNQDDVGWLAGDAGLIMQTENGGVSWHPPAGKFPEAMKGTVDFRACRCAGNARLVRGKPRQRDLALSRSGANLAQTVYRANDSHFLLQNSLRRPTASRWAQWE